MTYFFLGFWASSYQRSNLFPQILVHTPGHVGLRSSCPTCWCSVPSLFLGELSWFLCPLFMGSLVVRPAFGVWQRCSGLFCGRLACWQFELVKRHIQDQRMSHYVADGSRALSLLVAFFHSRCAFPSLVFVCCCQPVPDSSWCSSRSACPHRPPCFLLTVFPYAALTVLLPLLHLTVSSQPLPAPLSRLPACPCSLASRHSWRSFKQLRHHLDEHFAGLFEGGVPLDWLCARKFGVCRVLSRVLSLRFNEHCPSVTRCGDLALLSLLHGLRDVSSSESVWSSLFAGRDREPSALPRRDEPRGCVGGCGPPRRQRLTRGRSGGPALFRTLLDDGSRRARLPLQGPVGVEECLVAL